MTKTAVVDDKQVTISRFLPSLLLLKKYNIAIYRHQKDRYISLCAEVFFSEKTMMHMELTKHKECLQNAPRCAGEHTRTQRKLHC